MRKVGWHAESKVGTEVFPNMKKKLSFKEKKNQGRHTEGDGVGSRTTEEKHTLGDSQVCGEEQKFIGDPWIELISFQYLYVNTTYTG